MTDRELIERYVRGEGRDDAFRAMVERYAGMVHAACVRQLRDTQLAEDATQAVFVLLSEKAGGVREGKLAGWLLGVARFVCVRVKRERLRRDRRERAAALRSEAVMEEAHGEMRELLDDGLMRLGVDDREALALRYLGDQPLKGVADAMGISEEAARKRVTRAVEKLRHYFARCGVVAGAGVVIAVLGDEAARGATAGGPLVEKVMQTCRGGGLAGSHAAEIAKGTKTMMTVARLKSVGVAAVVVLVAGLGVAAVARGMTGRGGAAGVTGIVLVKAPATTETHPALVGDRSTPTKSLETLCDAMHAGDRAATYACLTADPARKPTLMDGMLEATLAENRLTNAAVKAFGPAGQQVRTMTTGDDAGMMIRMMFGGFDQVMQVQVEGAMAKLTMSLSPEVLQLVPASIRGDLQDLKKKPLFMTKVGGDWKLDMDRSFHVNMDFGRARVMTGKQSKACDIAVVLAFAKSLDDVTGRVESGELDSIVATKRAVQAAIATVMRENGVTAFNFDTVLAGEPEK